MPSLGIATRKTAYLPEAAAYERYLNARGWQVQVAPANDLATTLDLHLHFMGVLPFWKRLPSGPRHVFEYHSLSTQQLPTARNWLKRVVEHPPAGRIFLNETVRREFGFSDLKPYLLRDMGVDASFFECRDNAKQFDIVYCGSVSGRKGLIEEIVRLSSIGLRVLVIGDPGGDQENRLLKGKNIELTGRLGRDEIPIMLSQCRFGLNYTPNIYPYNIQTSTKTLEYCAAGLPVISNRYLWVEDFFQRRSGSCVWLDTIISIESLDRQDVVIPDVSDLEWSILLESIGFANFLKQLAGSK